MESAFSEFRFEPSASSMVMRAFANGFCATLVFLVFLFFLARYIRKHECPKDAPESIVVETPKPLQCPYDKPPPTYEVLKYLVLGSYKGKRKRTVILIECVRDAFEAHWVFRKLCRICAPRFMEFLKRLKSIN